MGGLQGAWGLRRRGGGPSCGVAHFEIAAALLICSVGGISVRFVIFGGFLPSVTCSAGAARQLDALVGPARAVVFLSLNRWSTKDHFPLCRKKKSLLVNVHKHACRD